MTVKASIVVQFGVIDSSTYTLVAELDSDSNENKTNFVPGDSVYFKVYTDLPSYSVLASSGTVSKINSSVASSEEELVTFALEDTATVSKPINAISSIVWYGATLGNPTKINTNTVKISNKDIPYIGLLTYSTEFDRWKLTPPTITEGVEYSIVIVIYGG